jgi:hypothetical protein
MLPGLPRVRLLDLAPLGVDPLAEVPRPGYQRHEHQRQLEVGAGAGGVAREDPESAGIGMHLGASRDLHREIRDARPCNEGIEWRHHVGSYQCRLRSCLSGRRAEPDHWTYSAAGCAANPGRSFYAQPPLVSAGGALTVTLFWTAFTPGAVSAATRMASFCASEPIRPQMCTIPPATTTLR